MNKFDASRIPWRVPWLAISPDVAPKTEAELHREMCEGHVLFGRSVAVIGCRQDCDDTLFYLGDSKPQFAVVHLTYQKENRLEWPETALFDSLEAWIEKCMIPDSEDWTP